MKIMHNHRITFFAAAVILLVSVPAGAQVSTLSAPAIGMGENFSARAIGYHAVAWNPAMLGTRANARMSFVTLGAQGIQGLDPVTLSELNTYQDELVPETVKREWLDRITSQGGQSGTGGADLTWLGFQFGPAALHFSTTAGVRGTVSPGIAELLMFGNVAPDGTGKDLDLGGSIVRSHGFSAFGASFGHPIELGEGRLSLGITATYILGHVTAWGDQSTGATSDDPLGVHLSFPFVYVEDGYSANAGNGFGIDLGAAYEFGMWTVAASLRNAVNTFAWDESRLIYRPFAVHFDEDEQSFDVEEQPFSAAPLRVREAVAEETFRPMFGAGMAAQVRPDVIVTADLRAGSSRGIVTAPTTHVGMGAEWTPTAWLQVRAGGAYVALGEEVSGVQFGTGVGFLFGPMNLSLSVARRSTDLGIDTMLSFGGISAFW
jgi:hypothetical protein